MKSRRLEALRAALEKAEQTKQAAELAVVVAEKNAEAARRQKEADDQQAAIGAAQLYRAAAPGTKCYVSSLSKALINQSIF